MAHYNSYDSFKTTKSLAKKQKAKTKVKQNIQDFIIENSNDFGIVIEANYHNAFVLYQNKIVTATLKKNLNLVCNQTVFPGDKVVLEKNNDSYQITNLIKRTTLLSRVKKDGTRLNEGGTSKNIAANIDLAVIVVSCFKPALHAKFIDRYLMVIQNSNIPVVICLNKCELKSSEEEKIINIYRDLGIEVIETSTYENKGLADLKKCLKNKQAILVGNSGVGKSSLINFLMDAVEAKTSKVSEKTNRGRHTTTTSKYYVWDANSSIIDTPGIRSLDVSSFKASEIQNYFPDFNNLKDKCKYNNCLHYKEPIDSCFIKQAVAKDEININRYESYLRIMQDILKDNDYSPIIEEIKLKR